MKESENYQKKYEILKESIITDIRTIIKSQPARSMEIMETKNCPAIVTFVIDDQECEVISELYIDGSHIKAIAGVYESESEYDLDEFEIPMLVAILESVEIHLDMPE